MRGTAWRAVCCSSSLWPWTSACSFGSPVRDRPRSTILRMRSRLLACRLISIPANRPRRLTNNSRQRRKSHTRSSSWHPCRRSRCQTWTRRQVQRSGPARPGVAASAINSKQLFCRIPSRSRNSRRFPPALAPRRMPSCCGMDNGWTPGPSRLRLPETPCGTSSNSSCQRPLSSAAWRFGQVPNSSRLRKASARPCSSSGQAYGDGKTCSQQLPARTSKRAVGQLQSPNPSGDQLIKRSLN